nr:hypothetical protein [uncultured bacterium]
MKELMEKEKHAVYHAGAASRLGAHDTLPARLRTTVRGAAKGRNYKNVIRWRTA